MPASEERDRAYAEVIGAKFDAFDDTSAEPPLQVRRYTGKPVKNGPVCDIWVTSGMSDLPMEDDDGDSLRRELIFYAPTGGNFIQALLAVARYPFDEQTYLDQTHTLQTYGAFFVPGGTDVLIAEGPSGLALPHLLFLSPLLAQHQRLSEVLVIDGDAVEFLWVVPISQAELDLKKREGVDALLDVFQEKKLPWLFDPARQSVV